MYLVRTAVILFAVMAFTPQAFASDVLDIVFNIRNAGTAIFSHKTHLATKAINENCTLCHERLYREKSKRPVTMAEMEKGKSCGACHNKIAFPLAQCGRCHEIRNVTFTVRPTGDVIFVHAPHTKKFGCGSCHPRLFNTGRNPTASMAQMEKGRSCGACHTGTSAFDLDDCSRCHLAGDVFMKVEGAGPVTFSHSFHVALYPCRDCHTKIFALGYKRDRFTMLDMEQGKSCGACHNDYTAFTTREDCVRCHDM
jgi:c(7)-type cytochrome triheme protein